jgi:hypothetical protein
MQLKMNAYGKLLKSELIIVQKKLMNDFQNRASFLKQDKAGTQLKKNTIQI